MQLYKSLEIPLWWLYYGKSVTALTNYCIISTPHLTKAVKGTVILSEDAYDALLTQKIPKRWTVSITHWSCILITENAWIIKKCMCNELGLCKIMLWLFGYYLNNFGHLKELYYICLLLQIHCNENMCSFSF